jgi:rhodanese-related sulfurtransferase
MPTSVKQMIAAANAAVERIDVARARELIAAGGVLLVDVRDAPEVQQSGKLKGALNVSRGMLELRADPDFPMHHEAFTRDATVIVYCGTGGRAALCGKALQNLGYTTVYNLGAFKDCAEAGMETEPA